MSFNLHECIVRLAVASDKADLLQVAKGIWGGSDYLPKVIDHWLDEPWFLVCEYRGKAVACLKMTMFPDNVLWFEGLRVQHRYQNKGIATLMNHHSLALAQQIKLEIPEIKYEFCTYYQNVESLHLTQKLGFQVVEKFYVLDKRGIQATMEPKILPDIDASIFRNYPRYFPCAWQSVHSTPVSLPFLKEHGKLFQTPYATYFIGGLHEKDIVFLEPPKPTLKKDLPYFQHFFGSRKKYGIVIPLTFKSSLPLLHDCGFRFWDNEPAENMLILRV